MSLSPQQLQQLQQLLNGTGIQPLDFITQLSAPLINEINGTILPVVYVMWFLLGIVILDGVHHAIKYDWQLIRRWRNINACYFILRLAGTATQICYTVWTTLGTTSLCDSTLKAAVVFESFAIGGALAIFYARVSALTRFNRIIMAGFAILGVAIVALLFWCSTLVFADPSPSFAPLIVCTPGFNKKYVVAIVASLMAVYDIGILAITFWALRKFKTSASPSDGQVGAVNFKWIILRGNIGYFMLVGGAEILQGILIFLPLPPMVALISTPITIAMTTVLGCRVFIELKFETSPRHLLKSQSKVVRDTFAMSHNYADLEMQGMHSPTSTKAPGSPSPGFTGYQTPRSPKSRVSIRERRVNEPNPLGIVVERQQISYSSQIQDREFLSMQQRERRRESLQQRNSTTQPSTPSSDEDADTIFQIPTPRSPPPQRPQAL